LRQHSVNTKKKVLSPRQYLQDITITCQEKSMPKNDVIAKAIFIGYNNYLSGKVDAKKRCYCQGNITTTIF
jgi:hypothetical protein